MTTVIINEKTKKGRIILDLIREMSCGKIITDNLNDEKTPNDKTRMAFRDAIEGKSNSLVYFAGGANADISLYNNEMSNIKSLYTPGEIRVPGLKESGNR